MSRFENPLQFEIRKEFDGHTISYSDLMEIAQGGPVVGTLSIDGRIVSPETRFGGPALYDKGFLYAPAFFRRFFSTGFKLYKIDVKTLEVESIGKLRNLIFLERVEGGLIHFYTDMRKGEVKFIDV